MKVRHKVRFFLPQNAEITHLYIINSSVVCDNWLTDSLLRENALCITFACRLVCYPLILPPKVIATGDLAVFQERLTIYTIIRYL